MLLAGLALLALPPVLDTFPGSPLSTAKAAEPSVVRIPYGSALIPDDLPEGTTEFRLLIITSRDTISNVDDSDNTSNINSLNTLVQEGANNNSTLAPHSDEFRALVSTSSVHARDNTETTGTGVPIYWFNGAKVADNYADFYDGSWDSGAARNHDGDALGGLARCAWTGTTKSGTKGNRPLGSSDFLTFGCAHESGKEINKNVADNAGDEVGLYALSPVFKRVYRGVEPSTSTITVTEGQTDTYKVRLRGRAD